MRVNWVCLLGEKLLRALKLWRKKGFYGEYPHRVI